MMTTIQKVAVIVFAASLITICLAGIDKAGWLSIVMVVAIMAFGLDDRDDSYDNPDRW